VNDVALSTPYCVALLATHCMVAPAVELSGHVSDSEEPGGST
jgi:hypothetical protein